MSFSSDSMSLKFVTDRLARLALAGLAIAGFSSAPARAIVYTYENTTAGNIPELGTDAACNGVTALVRTFTVPDSFTVSTIALGLNITHTDRGQVRAILNSPTGTSLVFLTQDAGDGNANYDVYLSPLSDGGGTNPVNDGDDDPVSEPYYHRLVNIASGFYTGNASASGGVWTLRVCDRDNAGGLGTLNRARLVLTSAAAFTPVCSSRTGFDFCPGCAASPPAAATSTAFPGGGVTNGNVTLTLTNSTLTDGTPSARNFSRVNTQTGGEFGYYVTEFDADATEVELVRSETSWAFSVPVNDLQWVQLDEDRSSWEDYVRVRGLRNGNEVRYSISTSAVPSYQISGELLETDSDSTPPDTFGNAFWNFDSAVSSIRSEYWAGDDFNNPNQQFIGYGSGLYCAYDFGDAPLTYGSAGQLLGDRTLYLGAVPPDGEAVTPAAPNAAATTDDITVASGSIDDEDGVPSFPNTTIVAGGTYTVPNIVVHNATGATVRLCGWIDFDTNGQGGATGDGAFGSDEGSCITVPLASGGGCTVVGTTATCSLTWTVPADYVRNNASTTYARFRVSTGTLTTSSFNDVVAGAPSTNPGEVEDYQIASATLPVTIAHVATTPSGGSLTVRFTTASEAGNAGFRIWGMSSTGKRFPLATVKSQAPDSFAPQSYEATVAGAGVAAIEIEDVSLFGNNRIHGPFAVGAEAGEEPAAASVDWASVKSDAGIASDLDRVVAAENKHSGSMSTFSSPLLQGPGPEGLLLVRNTGIHRVTYEALQAAGIDLAGVKPQLIAIIDNGVGVPRYVETSGKAFGPGSSIEFVARPKLTLASPVDVYAIKVDASRAIDVIAPPASRTSGVGVTRATDEYRPDNVYSFSSPNGDPWMDAQVLAWGGPGTATRTFDLPDLGAGPVSLNIRVWGWGDFDGAAPDHHVVVKLNGVDVGQRRFDGLIAWEPQLDVTGVVQPAGNVLEISVPGDTGYPFDNIAFEGFGVTYSRSTVAVGGRFSGSVVAPGTFTIGGLNGAQQVSVWTISGAKTIRGQVRPSGGPVTALGGGLVYAAAQSALYQPGIAAGIPVPKLASTAEYLIVTHPALADAVGDLVALEESRGFATEVVTTDRIFAAYSDYASSAGALKSFLSASLAGGNLHYVLLVGADTTDPYNHLGLGSISYVPTDYKNFAQFVTYTPTDESLVDRANDGVGDVPIGRLPVRTPAEVDAVVAKLYAWEQAIGAGQPSALLAAGASDGDNSLSSLNESYASSLPGWNTVLAQVDDSNVAIVRQQVLDAINAGAHLVSYVGHSSMGQWDNTPLLKWQDAATLTNAGLPNLITSWGCWNSYYVEPNIESLSARLLRQPDAGAAGVIGATTLTTDASHRLLGNLFFARVNAGAATVGEAFHGAKQDLMQMGGAADAIYGMTLLGDPAMSLPQLP